MGNTSSCHLATCRLQQLAADHNSFKLSTSHQEIVQQLNNLVWSGLSSEIRLRRWLSAGAARLPESSYDGVFLQQQPARRAAVSFLISLHRRYGLNLCSAATAARGVALGGCSAAV